MFRVTSVTLTEYMSQMAAGDLLRAGTSGRSIVENVVSLSDHTAVQKPCFDRASVRANDIEDLFISNTFTKKDPLTGTDVPYIYRKKINPANTYHDYKYTIDNFLANAKSKKIIEPYAELISYQTAVEKECIFHYCYYYDIISKVPISILEREPSIINYYMIILKTLSDAGNTKEAALIKESILYLISSSKVFRDTKDKLGNYPLYYCSDLEIFAKYLLLSPEYIDQRNKCGVNILLSGFINRDIRLLILNFCPSIIYQTVKTDSSINTGTEYLFYSLTDSFIVRYIIDMILGDMATGYTKPATPTISDGGILLNTETKNTIFNTSKCFDSLLYLVKRIKPATMADYVRNHKECYEVLFSNKIKVIGIKQNKDGTFTPVMEYITFDGYKSNSSYIELNNTFNDFITNKIWD